jgi:hypothetical protein
MKKGKTRRGAIPPAIKNLGGRLYGQDAAGQMIRLDPNGKPIPRIRISKKERLRLRKELRKINEMDSQELTNKIVESIASVPVVNPKPEEWLKIEREFVEQNA